MSVTLSQQKPAQFGSTRRRPGMPEFDSLQDLLEEAGYKETRIFTPIAIRVPSSSHETLDMAADQPAASTSRMEAVFTEDKAPSNWFSTLWPSSSHNRKSKLNHKQSEPVLSKKSRKAVQKSWMGTWSSSKGSPDDRELPPVPVLPKEYQPADVQPPAAEQPSIPPRQSQPLRHVSSTNNLWKGSLHHHKSFPAKLRDQHLQGKTIVRKESFDGVGVVAGVGVGAAKTVAAALVSREDQRATLRQAFEEEGEVEGQVGSSNFQDRTIQDTAYDSVNSIVDLQEVKASAQGPQQERLPLKSLAPAPTTASLFSVAATPVLSRQDAVAMRNVDCLDFAGSMQHDDHSGRPSTKGLRKMRSVDALELALARLEGQRQSGSSAPFQRQATIPESFSADSLTNEDLGANAITTVVGDAVLSDGQFEDAPSIVSNSFTEEVPMLRSGTPRLVITSPTGMRSPQPLVLEGQEFEPRSISPRKLQTIRPVPSRPSSSQGGWKLNAVLGKPETGDVEVVAKRSVSKRRSRVIKSRSNTADEVEQRPAPTTTGKPAKKRQSKSCNDLRGSAARGAEMSGSEQIRALRRDIIEREVVEEVGLRHYSILSEHTATNVPFNQFDDDEEDPFSDFTAVTSNKPASHTRQQHRGRGSAPADIDRKMSPIPFDHLKRRPLSTANVVAANSIGTDRHNKVESALSRKRSGVGLACLVQKPAARPISPRSSSLSSQDENAPPSLLDSPTANIAKKRSSRIRLSQR